jgi:hypothetical protein
MTKGYTVDDQPFTSDAPATEPVPDDAAAAPATADEYAARLADIWREVADASAQLAADVTSVWWKALPVARPGGLDLTGSAAMLAARLVALGPEGDPLEMMTLGMIAYAQGAHAQALAEVEQIEQKRRALREGNQ